jgi:hypothetical protein
VAKFLNFTKLGPSPKFFCFFLCSYRIVVVHITSLFVHLMLFECWIIYLGIRYIALWVYYNIQARQVVQCGNNNNANTKTTKKHKSRKGHKAQATSSADNTENEQEARDNRRSMPSPYSSTPIAITKRTFSGTADDDGHGTESHTEPETEEEEDDGVVFNSGITIKPAGKTSEPVANNDIATHAIKRDNIYGSVFKNNVGTSSGYGGTSNNNNADPYGGSSVANKYGYYGRKSFASGMFKIPRFNFYLSCLFQYHVYLVSECTM